MKRVIPTALAALLFAGMLAFVLWGPKGATKPANPQAEAEKIVAAKYDEVNQIEVRTPDFTLSVAKESVQEGDKTKDVWSFGALQNVEVKSDETVDQTKVTSFLYMCCPLTAKKKIAAKAEDLAPFGLDAPQWTVLFNGGAFGLEVGALNEAAQGYYARPRGSDAVYLVDNLLANYLPKSGRDWVKPADEKKAE